MDCRNTNTIFSGGVTTTQPSETASLIRPYSIYIMRGNERSYQMLIYTRYVDHPQLNPTTPDCKVHYLGSAHRVKTSTRTRTKVIHHAASSFTYLKVYYYDSVCHCTNTSSSLNLSWSLFRCPDRMSTCIGYDIIFRNADSWLVEIPFELVWIQDLVPLPLLQTCRLECL